MKTLIYKSTHHHITTSPNQHINTSPHRLIITLANLLLITSIFAQAPEKISYQAIVQDSSGKVISNQTVGMQISILQGSSGGTLVYKEKHSPTSNANGLLSIVIGEGTVISGSFSAINWANGTYYIKSETDLSGGSTYSISGISPLISVPYALHAKTADSLTGAISESDPSVPSGTQIGQMQYWNGTSWTIVQTGNDSATLSLINGIPTWVGGISIPNVSNPITGKIWMDRNLGASQVATSSTDAAAYGDLYQWGRGTDGHEKRNSGTTSTLSSSNIPGHGNFILTSGSPLDWRNPQNDNLWQGVSGINNPCPSAYRLPTEAEWNAERTSWSSNNSAGAFASPLKLPVAGIRYYSNGSLNDVGSIGGYWSSTLDGTGSRRLYFYSSSAGMSSHSRASGFSVRCLKD
jgi:uncharacterized protein (TIGR02145 family)